MARVAWLLLLVSSLAFAAEPVKTKPRIAVLYFDARTDDASFKTFTKGLAALLISDLATDSKLDIVERERLEDVLAELKLGESRFADASTFARVGKLLGAQYLVVGQIIGTETQQFINARVVNPETGITTPGGKVEIDGRNVFDAEEKLVDNMRGALVKLGATTAIEPTRRNYKLSLDQAKKYAAALDAKDKKDQATAKKLLTEVVAEQPQFKLAQLDLVNLTN